MIPAQQTPAPTADPSVNTLKLASLSVLIWGTQPVYLSEQARMLRQCEQEGLVAIDDNVPHPPALGQRKPHFYARLTRAGQVLLGRPAGEA